MLDKYFSIHFQKSLELLDTYSQETHPETLHQFRVSLKRLRFVGGFLKDMGFETQVKEFNKVCKDVFRLAGKTREVDVLTELLSDRISEKKYKHLFNELELLKKDDFHIEIKEEVNLLNTTGEEIRSILEKIDSNLLNDYFETQYESAFRFAQNQRIEDFHSLRKLIKILLYSIEATGEAEVETLKPKFNQKQIDKLQNKIGKWHDLQDLIIFLVKHSGNKKILTAFIEDYDKSGKAIKKLMMKAFQENQKEKRN